MLLTCPNCHHTFVAAEDAALQRELRYLYEWLFEKCEGKTACDAVDNIVPEWWYHISDDTECQPNTTVGVKYFNGIVYHWKNTALIVESHVNVQLVTQSIFSG